MSTELDRELERLYAGLAHETQYTPLASPESLRKRGDRQTRTRATLAVAAVAVIAAGVVGGGSVLLDDRGTKVPPAPQPTTSLTPAPSTTSSPSTSPSSTPSAASSPSSSSSRTVAANPPPTVVPKSVFLTAKDLNSTEPLSKSEESFLPPLCDEGWGDTEPRTSSVQGSYMRPREADATEVPQAVFREAVVVYRSTAQAREWMEGLRQAVQDCPTQKATAGRGGTYRNALVPDADVVAEDWAVIRHQEPAYDFATGELAEGYYDFYTASVRFGDTVVTFHTAPYENWGIEDPTRFYELVGIGAERVATWRGPTG